MNPPRRAQLALLLEVASTPTPGAVDRMRDHDDLRFDHFLAGAIGASDGLQAAAADEPLGAAFEQAVEGMAAAQTAGNTQFGALLLLIPLVRAASGGELTPETAATVVDRSTVADARAFCRAFDAVDVGLGEPPEALADVDVRQPATAAAAVDRRGMALDELMVESADTDGIAREWTTEFERSFHAAVRLENTRGALTDRAARVYLELLADEPDPFIETRHDPDTARQVSADARSVLEGQRDVDEWAASLIRDGINPGTTADLLAAGLYIALERGATV